MRSIADASAFLGATVGLILAALAIGYLPARAVTGIRGPNLVLAAVPFGVTIVVAVTGAIAVFYAGPLVPIVPVVCIALLLAGSVVVVRDGVRRLGFARAGSRRLAMPAAIASFGAVAAVAWQERGGFGYGVFTVSSWNTDILGYALGARHLAEFGTGQAGWIIGHDQGLAARLDVLGAYTFVVAAAVPFGDALLATPVIMATVTVALAMGVFSLAIILFPRHPYAAVVVSLVAIVGYAPTYNAFQYFLSERLAIVAILSALIVFVRPRPWKVGLPAIIAAQAIATVAILTDYPHMLPVQVALGVAVLIAGAGSGLRLRFLRGGACAGAALTGTAVGAAVIAPYVGDRIARIQLMLTAAAGWPMPTNSLIEALGLQDPFKEALASPAVLVELCVFLGLAAIVAVFTAGGGRRSVLVAIALMLPMAVFANFALNEPDSYRQWRAMSLAAPFAAVGVGVVLVILLESVAIRYAPSRNQRSRLVSIGATGVLLVALAGAFGTRLDPAEFVRTCDLPDCRIDAAVRAKYLEYERTAGSGPIAIARGPLWGSMVAGYFLWGRPIALRDPTNWGSSGAPATKTLGPDGWIP